MELITIKVISRNDEIRGKDFDVYFEFNHDGIHLTSVEEVTESKNLIEKLSEQDLKDIKFSLNEVISTKNIQQMMDKYSQVELNVGYVADAIANTKKGWTND